MLIRSLPFFIGLRYIRAKKRSQFLSFISLASMVGIALGVMVLITVLSVFNGFNQVIKQQLFSMVPHITITSSGESIHNWQPLLTRVEHYPNITGASPYVSGQALLSEDQVTQPAMMMGIDPSLYQHVSELYKKMDSGSLSALKPGRYGIVLGKELAGNLGVIIGDKINVMIPKVSVTPVGVIPRFKRFTVVGIFSSGAGFGFDSGYAYVNMQDAQNLYSMPNAVSGLQVDTNDLFAAGMIAEQLQKTLGFNYQVLDWGAQYGAFYKTIQIQKTMMFLIMLLLIAIAIFNLVSSLVMLVNEKQADIAILRTLGMTPKQILQIFIYQGAAIGVIGIVIGLVCGILLSLNITAVVNFIQSAFHVQLLSSSVNFVNYLPSKLEFSDLWHVSIIAFLMSLIATLYPAWRASKVQPAEALRYE